MVWGLAQRGWTSVDAGDGASLAAVSLKTAVRPGERPQVVSAALSAADDGAPDTSALRALLADSPKGFGHLVTLPRSSYTLRVMAEPAVPARDMVNTLRWSISVDSDDPGQDLNLAWMRIPTETELPTRQRQIYAISTPTVALKAQLATWKPAGFKPKVVDIRETALRNVAAQLERPGEGLALMAADSDGVGIVFTHRGSLYLDRYIPQTEAEVAQADEIARVRLYERIAQQLMRSVDVVNRSYPFMPVSRVVVAPMPSRPGCVQWLASHVPIPMEPLDLNAVVDLSTVPALAESPAMQARCLVPLGAALRGLRSSS